MKWKNTFNDNSDKVNNEIKKGTEYQSTEYQSSRLFFIFRRSSKFSIKKGLKFYSHPLICILYRWSRVTIRLPLHEDR